jgi:hypothetical protein
MFTVTEDEASTIRNAFEQEGELSAGVELRRLFPGITDGARAREMARVIAGWKPMSVAQLSPLFNRDLKASNSRSREKRRR